MTPFTPVEKKKNKKIKELVLGVVKAMDNDKQYNVKRYEDMFKLFEQDPDSFRKWSVLNDDSLDSSISMFCLPFEEPSMPQIKAAADVIHCPLEEYIYYRMNDPRGIRTKTKVPVGYIHIKRTQQLLSKKNHYAFTNDDRSLKTGDVKGEESKCASLSDVESFALQAIDADETLKELLGPRADNQKAKLSMYREIARDGYCALQDLPKNTAGTTLTTVNTYLLASGIRSDLINDSLKTEYTIDQDLKQN